MSTVHQGAASLGGRGEEEYISLSERGHQQPMVENRRGQKKQSATPKRGRSSMREKGRGWSTDHSSGVGGCMGRTRVKASGLRKRELGTRNLCWRTPSKPVEAGSQREKKAGGKKKRMVLGLRTLK